MHFLYAIKLFHINSQDNESPRKVTRLVKICKNLKIWSFIIYRYEFVLGNLNHCNRLIFYIYTQLLTTPTLVFLVVV